MKIVATLAAAGLLAGCTATLPPIPAAPALPAETIPLPPISEAPLIWQPGDWIYAGASYRYQAGEYVPVEGHGRLWQFGQWAGTRPTYTWVPGHWTN